MSVVAECALVEAAIERVKSLVSPHVPRPREVTLGDIAVAARSTAMTTEMVGGSSGVVIAAHRRFATRNAASLRLAGRTDHGLAGQMRVAAAAAQRGALRIDAIAGQTQATRQAGAVAISPAAQRAILTALRLQLSRAKGVVDSISRQSAELAGRIQGLDYEFPYAPPPLEQPLTQGPIVWCLRPRGTFGSYRCSILYPDLSVSTYWSPTDDTNGSA
jgi:hypothetical protein